MLVISFKTQELRDTCHTLENAENRYGSLHAAALVEVLADAEALDNAADFIALYRGSGCVVVGDSISLKIGSEYVLSWIALGVGLQRTVEGEIVWSSVTRLKLMTIDKCP